MGNTLFEENLKALRREGETVVHNLTQVYCREKTEMDPEQVRWGKDLTGRDIPYCMGEDGTFVCLGSEYSAEHAWSVWFQQFDGRMEKTLLVYVMGLGMADRIRTLYDCLPEKCVLVIYEPSVEFFFQMIERYDFTDIFSSSRVHLFLRGVNANKMLSSILEYCQKRRIGEESIFVLHMPSYQRAYPKATAFFDDCLIDWRLFSETNKLTAAFWLKEVVGAPLNRLYYYKDAVIVEKMWEDWNRDIPVVMVAGGPSLNKNAGYLRQAKGHMLIVAVDRALSTLHREGVVPDIIVNVDSLDAYMKIGEEFRDVPMMCNTRTGKESFDWNTGVKIMLCDTDLIQRLKVVAGLPVIGYQIFGSVAIVIVAVFAMLRAKNIILLGQDLAFAEDGCSHADGSVPEGPPSEMTLPGYYGGEVRTRPDWHLFWRWYVRNIPEMKDSRIINATEGGVHIPGTVQMSFREVLKKYGDYKLDKSFLEDSRFRITPQEYASMQENVGRYMDEYEELAHWTRKEFQEGKERINTMWIGEMLDSMMYGMEEEDTEWDKFQKALTIFRENGWGGDWAGKLSDTPGNDRI